MNGKSFASILEEKMREETPSVEPRDFKKTHSIEWSVMQTTNFHFEQKPSSPKNSGQYTSYSWQKVTIDKQKKSVVEKPQEEVQPVKKEEVLPLKQLKKDEKEIYLRLVEACPNFLSKEGLKKTQLKKAFRQLAKELHPDHNPEADPDKFHRMHRDVKRLEKTLEAALERSKKVA